MRIVGRLLLVLALLSATAAPAAWGQHYHVVNTWTLGGEGGWDYLSLDSASHCLFIVRSDRVMVVDPADGTVVGEVPGVVRGHGAAFDDAAGRGYVTSGGDSSVVAFDLHSLAPLAHIRVAPGPDAILFDPATGRIFTMNGRSSSATALDGATGRNLGNVDLGGGPEFAVAAGDGELYVNLEDKSEVVEVDARALKVVRRWPLAPCESPSGLAIDRAHGLLFSGCHNQVMAISDIHRGAVIATVPIGRGVDACRFDPGTGLAFASNGEGNITVIRRVTDDSFAVVANVPTRPGARTMELDPFSHALYTVTAAFEPPAPGERRGRMVPGSFVLLRLLP